MKEIKKHKSKKQHLGFWWLMFFKVILPLQSMIYAQETHVLTDYITAALTNNPGIKAAYYDWQSEMQQITVAKHLPNPSISFSYFLQNIETAVGPQEYKIGFNQMFPWFGKLKIQGDIQTLQAEIAHYNLRNRSNELRMQVIQTYNNYYLLQQSITTMQWNIDLLHQWESLLLSKYANSQKTYSDVINIQIELQKHKDELQSLTEKQKSVIENFRRLVYDSTIQQIKVPDNLHPDQKSFTLEKLLNIIDENNPELLAASTRRLISQKTIQRKKLDYFPDIGIGADYIFTGDKFVNNAKVPESGKDPFAVGVSLSLPIWLKKQQAGLESAQYKNQATLNLQENLRNQLIIKASNLLYRYDDASRKINLYKGELIPKSIELLKFTETAYISGNTDILTLMDAQRKYLQFSLEYEHTIVDCLNILAEIEYLTGSKL